MVPGKALQPSLETLNLYLPSQIHENLNFLWTSVFVRMHFLSCLLATSTMKTSKGVSRSLTRTDWTLRHNASLEGRRLPSILRCETTRPHIRIRRGTLDW